MSNPPGFWYPKPTLAEMKNKSNIGSQKDS